MRHAHSPLYCGTWHRNGNGVTERQHGHGFTETVTETDMDERKRNAGNQALRIDLEVRRE